MRRATGAVVGGLAIVGAGLAVYLPTPGDHWIRYDNEVRIRRSPQIRALTLEGAERLEAVVGIFTGPNEDQYQPLHTLSLALDHALFGWNRAGFHAHSLALHLAAMLLLFLLAVRLCGDTTAALLAVLAVSVHPIAVEGVFWTIHRNLLVASLWTLLATHAYLVYARDPRRRGFGIAGLAGYAISLLGKFNLALVLIPFWIDLWVRRPFSRRVVLEKVPLAVAAVALGVVNMRTTGSEASERFVRPTGEVLTELPSALLLNAANTLVPERIALFYPAGRAWQLVGWRWVAVLLAASALLVVGRRLWRTGARGLLLATALWVALVVPNLVAAGWREYATADRYAQLALAFLGLGMADALARGFARLEATHGRAAVSFARATVLAGVAALALLAHAEARSWSDEAHLWQEVIAETPHPTAWAALGQVYGERGQLGEAVAANQHAIDLLPLHPRQGTSPDYHLGLVEYSLRAGDRARSAASDGSEDLARQHYDRAARAAQEATERWPDIAWFFDRLGRARLALGDFAGADAALAAALERDPRSSETRALRGVALRRLGRLDAAEESLRAALGSNWRQPRALQNLAEICVERRRFREAAELYLGLALLDPGRERAHRGFLSAVAAAADAEDPGQADLLERYLARFPDSTPARELLERLPPGARSAAGRPPPGPDR